MDFIRKCGLGILVRIRGEGLVEEGEGMRHKSTGRTSTSARVNWLVLLISLRHWSLPNDASMCGDPPKTTSLVSRPDLSVTVR